MSFKLRQVYCSEKGQNWTIWTILDDLDDHSDHCLRGGGSSRSRGDTRCGRAGTVPARQVPKEATSPSCRLGLAPP